MEISIGTWPEKSGDLRVWCWSFTAADRLANCIALACVTAWRIFRMAMPGRTKPATAPGSVFTKAELVLLDRTAPAAPQRQHQQRDLGFRTKAVVRLGGYLARRHDPPPGTTVLQRGFARLTDLVIGVEAANPPMKLFVGN